MLVHVVDAAGPDPVETYRMIRRELELFDPRLLDKPELVAANKMDLPEAAGGLAQLKRHLRGTDAPPIFPVSAVTHEGLAALGTAIRERLDAMRREEPEEELTGRVYRVAPEEDDLVVEREGDVFHVRGRAAERAVAMASLDSDEGIADLQRQLERTGVLRALDRAGVKAGDTVFIGAFELEWT